MSRPKAKSLAVIVPIATGLVLSAVLATPWLSTIPGAYATGGGGGDNGVDGNDKVKICHIPPGNPDNAHTIRVSENAVDAHLEHGDTLGKCKEHK
jgi:hypothetical protein